MLIDFFFTLRKYGLKTSITELLDLLNALKQQVVFADTEAFYQLSRLVLVKDESQKITIYDAEDPSTWDEFIHKKREDKIRTLKEIKINFVAVFIINNI